VSPWLITMTAWPAATALLVRVMVRVVTEPAALAVTATVPVLSGAALLARLRTHAGRDRRSTS